MKKYLNIMNNFNTSNIPSLDICVLGGLEFFMNEKITSFPKIEYEKSLVVGSGNALICAKILFRGRGYLFCSESSYIETLENLKEIKRVILISSSAKKHAPSILKNSKEIYGKKTYLLTNNLCADKKICDKVFNFKKNKEPYTYNFTTYIDMILSKTKEDVLKIYNFILKDFQKQIKDFDFSKYTSFFIILEDKFSEACPMIRTKFEEIFGPKLNYQVCSYSQTLHAKTLIEDDNQLFISLNVKNDFFGNPQNRLNLNFYEFYDYAFLISVSYYLVGVIQNSKPHYFKQNLVSYCDKISKKFDQKLSPIVEK